MVNGQDEATFTTSTLSTASHTITATYKDDGNFLASAPSTAITQVVNKDSTTTTIAASASVADFDQMITFTANVKANSPGAGTPTGSVDFFDTTTSTDLTPVMVSTGTLTSGSASVTSLSSTAPFFVGESVIGTGIPSGTTISQVNSSSAITLSQAATLKGSSSLTFEVLLSSGKATFSTASLRPGNQAITATYSSDGNFLTSTTSQVATVGVASSIYVLNGTASGASSSQARRVSPRRAWWKSLELFHGHRGQRSAPRSRPAASRWSGTPTSRAAPRSAPHRSRG